MFNAIIFGISGWVTMKIKSVEFVKSVVNVEQISRDNLKEIAFAGRSNVGKSSLINCLLNRKKVAKISSTPGKTRQLNYFRINRSFYFVDLPGYGFAKVSQAERLHWQKLIEGFLTRSANLMAVVSIIDSRIGATQLDLQLLEWLASLNRPILVVATKVDKLSKSVVIRQTEKLSKQLAAYTNEIIPFSAVKGTGKRILWNKILNFME